MSDTARVGLFPGTFDPISNGHLDVIRRGRGLFDRLIVAIARNPAKQELFTQEERLDMIKQLMDQEQVNSNIEITVFTGLTVDYARKIGATAILRGLRNVTDLNFEFQLALTNRAVADIETVFIMTGETYAFTSSTLIKQIASAGEVDRLHRLLPPLVLQRLKEKKQQMGDRFTALHQDELNE